VYLAIGSRFVAVSPGYESRCHALHGVWRGNDLNRGEARRRGDGGELQT
jgi:hypothetical protein